MAIKSWLDYDEHHDFPVENLPWGIFSTEYQPQPRAGIAIGDYVLEVARLVSVVPFEALNGKDSEQLFLKPTLNEYIALPSNVHSGFRAQLRTIFENDCAILRDNADLRRQCLVESKNVKLHLPISVGDYTDFYCGEAHAFNCGTMLRGKDNAMQPNWYHLPVGYHGRASTIVVSGTEIRRPWGQNKPADAPRPVCEPTRSLDYELEVGYIIGGPPTTMGSPVPIKEAKEHLFGVVILNDWSARDIQRWEAVPLGPFLAKSFGTSISPWIVELAALDNHRVSPPPRKEPLLPYLQDVSNLVDVNLEVAIKGTHMNDFQVVSESNLSNCYFSPEQFVAHHSINGCRLNPGDVFGTGTLSGPAKSSYGCLFESTVSGKNAYDLGGEQHTWLRDGDCVRMRGYSQGDGYRIGFGECSGTVLPAWKAVD